MARTLRGRPASWWKDCKDYPPEWKQPVDGQMEMFDDDGQDLRGDLEAVTNGDQL